MPNLVVIQGNHYNIYKDRKLLIGVTSDEHIEAEHIEWMRSHPEEVMAQVLGPHTPERA